MAERISGTSVMADWGDICESVIGGSLRSVMGLGRAGELACDRLRLSSVV